MTLQIAIDDVQSYHIMLVLTFGVDESSAVNEVSALLPSQGLHSRCGADTEKWQ